MKYLLRSLCLSILLLPIGLQANGDKGSPASDKPSGKDISELPSLVRSDIPLLLHEGQQVQAEGFGLFINKLSSGRAGEGVVHLPALGLNIAVTFENLQVNYQGELLSGRIEAQQESALQKANRGAELSDAFSMLFGVLEGDALPLALTDILLEDHFEMPDFSEMILEGLEITQDGAFMNLAFSTQTLTEGNKLQFKEQGIPLSPFKFCLEDIDMPIEGGDDSIDDFEFPLRIVKGNPGEEGVGSYITFSCEGVKNFNLQVEYDFPQDQLAPAPANESDTVKATFIINSPDLGSYVAYATIDPCEKVALTSAKK